MKNKWISIMIAAVMSISLLTACGSNLEAPQGDETQQENQEGQNAPEDEAKDSVIVVMGPTSEPEAGFDPAYGWGAGEHVHEPLIQRDRKSVV